MCSTVAVRGLLTQDSGGSLVCMAAAAVERDVAATLAPLLGPAGDGAA